MPDGPAKERLHRACTGCCRLNDLISRALSGFINTRFRRASSFALQAPYHYCALCRCNLVPPIGLWAWGTLESSTAQSLRGSHCFEL